MFARATGASRKAAREPGAVNAATPAGNRACASAALSNAAATTSNTSSKLEKIT